MELVLGLYNIRSILNVGAILRTAEGLGVAAVWTGGITPTPDDERVLPHLREKLNNQIHKTALGAEKMLPIKRAEDFLELAEEHRTKGFCIAGLENNLEDKRLISLASSNLRTKCGDKIFLILGEEVEGINAELLERCDVLLEIPMKGQKESFNVSVACGMALWELIGKTI